MDEERQNGFRLNGKLLSWLVPLLAALYFIGSLLYNLGQEVKGNNDYLQRLNQRLCTIEHILQPHAIVIDVECK